MIDMRETARKLFLGGAFWSGISSLAAPKLAGAGAILMLHRVNRSGASALGYNSHLTISPDFLDRLFDTLKRSGAALVSLDELLEGLSGGRRGMIAVTADDGWLDNLTDALPVFEKHQAPFTVYVTPGLVRGEVVPWWELVEEFCATAALDHVKSAIREAGRDDPSTVDRRSLVRILGSAVAESLNEEGQQAFLCRIGAVTETPARKFMNWDEIRRLAAHPLATIGAHTVHHYNLRRLSAEKALFEMNESAAQIEQETGVRPAHFAYPYGYERAAGPREVELAREAGFRSAVTTRHGVVLPEHAHHAHALPRISVNGNFQRISYMRTLLSGLTTPIANRGRRLVTV